MHSHIQSNIGEESDENEFSDSVGNEEEDQNSAEECSNSEQEEGDEDDVSDDDSDIGAVPGTTMLMEPGEDGESGDGSSKKSVLTIAFEEDILCFDFHTQKDIVFSGQIDGQVSIYFSLSSF